MKAPGLRVLVLGANYSPEPTGNAPYTSALSRALVARGADVRVITTFPHYPGWKVQDGYSGWSRSETIDGVAVLRVRHYVPGTPTPLRRLLAELSFGVRSAAARWPDADVVLLVSPSLFSAAVASARLAVGRRGRRASPGVVLWTQDLYSLGVRETGTLSGALARVVRQVERWVVRRADGVVAIHERFARHLLDDLGAAAGSVRTVRNWTHLAPTGETDVRAVREQLGWGEELVVLHAGNQGAKQGLENVVEAARLADGREAPVRFVLLGDGSRRRELMAAAAGVRSIQFVDPLPDDRFTQALRAADVLLVNELAGLAEMSVPSKLTSYFDAGRPVLAATSEGSTTAHELRDSGAGTRVDAQDPEALLAAALELGADPGRRRELGAAGRRYRVDVLSEEAAVDRFEEWLARHGGREGAPEGLRGAAAAATT